MTSAVGWRGWALWVFLIIVLLFLSEAAEDPFKVLGLQPGCSEAEIKKAYHRLALKYHPDKNRGPGAKEAEKNFIKIAAAYEVLSTQSRVNQYLYFLGLPAPAWICFAPWGAVCKVV